MIKTFVKAGILILLAAGAGCRPVKSVVMPVTETAVITDTALFRKVQQQTFQYFWQGAEPVSGLAAERIHTDNVYPENDKNIVTSGGAGFGVMDILVGIERNFVTARPPLCAAIF